MQILLKLMLSIKLNILLKRKSNNRRDTDVHNLVMMQIQLIILLLYTLLNPRLNSATQFYLKTCHSGRSVCSTELLLTRNVLIDYLLLLCLLSMLNRPPLEMCFIRDKFTT